MRARDAHGAEHAEVVGHDADEQEKLRVIGLGESDLGSASRVEAGPNPYRHTFLAVEVAQRVASATIVRVTTLDAQGRDGSGRKLAEAGSPLCGPIHVEGAMPGDERVARLRRRPA